MTALASLRVLVTRPEHQADALCDLLRASGAEPIRFATVVVRPPASFRALDRALADLTAWHWVIFTSANGVAAAFDRATRPGRTPPPWHAVRIAAVGPATAAALEARGVPPTAVPDAHRAEAVAGVLDAGPGARVLLFCADRAGNALERRLRAAGAQVDRVVAYRTLLRRPDPAAVRELHGGIDVVTFTSASTVQGLASVLGADWPKGIGGAVVATIGPVTSGAARAFGLHVVVEAEEPTAAGLVRALERHFSPPPKPGAAS